MHGWTSQPWHPTAVFMVKGARRDMNIPAKAGIQSEGAGFLDARLRGHDSIGHVKILLMVYACFERPYLHGATLSFTFPVCTLELET
jgi:hypothetical protein